MMITDPQRIFFLVSEAITENPTKTKLRKSNSITFLSNPMTANNNNSSVQENLSAEAQSLLPVEDQLLQDLITLNNTDAAKKSDDSPDKLDLLKKIYEKINRASLIIYESNKKLSNALHDILLNKILSNKIRSSIKDLLITSQATTNDDIYKQIKKQIEGISCKDLADQSHNEIKPLATQRCVIS